MNTIKLYAHISLILLLAGCGGGGSGAGSPAAATVTTTSVTPSTTTTSVPGQANVMPVTVNGPGCNAYPNEPCVSVTVCTPGTSDCQTIGGILLDTASYGLRIFKQAVDVPLAQVTAASGQIAECQHFADGSSDWGPVQTASVILGNEPSVEVPVQVIDSTFGAVPASCGTPDASPSAAGFNGILGIGPFVQDCGLACSPDAQFPNKDIYYACSGSSCAGTVVSLSSQVQNPVDLLPVDNNGFIVQLSSVPAGGSASAGGSVVLGIGTQSDNAASGVTVYMLDTNGNFSTTFNKTSYNGFLDTGSSGLYFVSAGLLPNCSGADAFWYCPSSTTGLSAVIAGASGVPTPTTVPFQIGNYAALTQSSNEVFSDIGGNSIGGFDWGLPFYYGRTVYMGIEGKTSSIGTGTYFAY